MKILRNNREFPKQEVLKIWSGPFFVFFINIRKEFNFSNDQIVSASRPVSS